MGKRLALVLLEPQSWHWNAAAQQQPVPQEPALGWLMAPWSLLQGVFQAWMRWLHGWWP